MTDMEMGAPGGAEPSAAHWSCWACREARTHCCHDRDHLPLAMTLARFFNHDNPGEKETSWFLDDAQAIAGYAGPGPWTVQRLEPVNCDQAVSVNGLVCILREGGKDCPAYLEPVCRLPERQAGSKSLHEALAVGIDRGLRDMGANLSGCTPSMLTGHVIRELRAADLVAGPASSEMGGKA